MTAKEDRKWLADFKKEQEQKQREREDKKPLVIESIAKQGEYSEEEKELIYQINEQVMGVDGTAEGWGGYNFDPMDYVETSAEIFNMAKSYFSKQAEQ